MPDEETRLRGLLSRFHHLVRAFPRLGGARVRHGHCRNGQLKETDHMVPVRPFTNSQRMDDSEVDFKSVRIGKVVAGSACQPFFVSPLVRSAYPLSILQLTDLWPYALRLCK